MTPPISDRARLMPASPIRKLMPLSDDARRRGIHIYHLNIGQPDLDTPEPMRRRLHELRDTVFAYTPSGGTPEYVATVRAYYEGLGIALGLEDIIATTGGSEALLFAFLACANEGDEALVVAGAAHQPRRGRLPPSSPRPVGEGARPAHTDGAPLQPQQPHRDRVPPRGAAHGRGLLP